MSILISLLTVILLAAVILLISSPLRAVRRTRAAESSERAALEASREAKYREIRDAELDWRTGKLSREDHQVIERTLRSEAMTILKRLDALGAVQARAVAEESADPDLPPSDPDSFSGEPAGVQESDQGESATGR